MRSDMHKVIVERPRVGRSRARKNKTKLRLNPNQAVDAGDAFDGGPNRVLVPYRDKHFNEHLSPLKRFLYTQVNRPWTKVYAEIVKGIDRRSVVGAHVLEHVGDFVQLQTILGEDGTIYTTGFRGGAHDLPVWGLYVHPITGILRRAKTDRAPWRKRQTDPDREPDLVVIDNRTTYRKLDGLWFFVERRFDEEGVELQSLKRSLDRKTIQRVEAGEFGPLRWLR
jgi:hypothetical protein